uniref:Uncharacterized protein n=1 Tax=Siphoviridae sp. ctOkv13 TaxID=2826314 RepID=A0A8S5M2W7_9CAUD|nr:MAG TPA: hypothetical protein [Siphoviridae sp. ctOkv13]
MLINDFLFRNMFQHKVHILEELLVVLLGQTYYNNYILIKVVSHTSMAIMVYI